MPQLTLLPVMEIPPTPFWTLSLASGLLVAVLAVFVWLRRSAPGAWVLFAALVSISHICVTAALEERSTTLAWHVFWQHVQCPGYASVSVCWLLMVMRHVGRPVSKRGVALLFVVPVLVVLMHWTDAWHHLYWKRIWIDNTGVRPIMGREYGLGFWGFMLYSHVVICTGLVVLLRHLSSQALKRRQTLMMIAAMTLPYIATVLYQYGLFPIRYLDITPYAFSVTGLCMFLVVFRYRFQGIVPVAMRSVVESMADGVIVLDQDQRVAEVNPAAMAMLGGRERRWVRRPAGEALAEDADLVKYCQGTESATGSVTLGEGEAQRHYSVTAVGLMRGDFCFGRVITLHDVTEERQTLERLYEARQAAEAATLAKSRFLATMSHEIRTPMSAVVGAIELLLDTPLNAEQRELMGMVRESAECLTATINDVLDFSKIDAGRLELEKVAFELPKLLDQVARVMRPIAIKKGLCLTFQGEAGFCGEIMGDPTRLRQVLLNLVGNAIKFTASGCVRMTLSRSGAERVAISVQDTGVGIAPERMETLFEEFSQADASVTRRFGGTGLGLAISRRLVERMGGRIQVKSELGQGSEFIVDLPVRRAGSGEQAGTSIPATTAPPELTGMRVLLAEDNALNQHIGRRLLEKLGCTVTVVANGREAVAVASAAPFDIILMDIHMPELDGLEATRMLRQHGLRAPVFALTASVLGESSAACRDAGMDGFLSKPIRSAEIAALLAQLGYAAGAVDAGSGAAAGKRI